MQTCVVGWPNRALIASLSASPSQAALPVSNLANDQGSAEQAWQTIGTSATLIATMTTDVAWRLVGLFRTNLTGTALIRWSVQDAAGVSSWTTGFVSANVAAGYGQTVQVLPLGVLGRRLVCDLQDDNNPDGFLNIALAYFGDAWQPLRNPDFGTSHGRTDQRTKAASRAGGAIIRSDWVKRTWDVSFSSIKQAEVWTRVMDLDLYARRGNNVLWVPDPLSPTTNLEALFGECEPAGNVTWQSGAGDARSWRMTFTERL